MNFQSMIVLLIRHGSTESFRDVLAGRSPGIHLSAEGEKEAARLATCLGGYDIAAIYSSPLERAVETARIVRDDARIEARLNEVDYGAWTGRTFTGLNEDALWNRFNAAQGHVRCPGGETMLEVQARTIQFLEEASKCHGDSYIAAISHAGVIRAAVCHYAGIALDLASRIEISPAAVTMIQVMPGNPRILTVNQSADFLIAAR